MQLVKRLHFTGTRGYTGQDLHDRRPASIESGIWEKRHIVLEAGYRVFQRFDIAGRPMYFQTGMPESVNSRLQGIFSRLL